MLKILYKEIDDTNNVVYAAWVRETITDVYGELAKLRELLVNNEAIMLPSTVATQYFVLPKDSEIFTALVTSCSFKLENTSDFNSDSAAEILMSKYFTYECSLKDNVNVE